MSSANHVDFGILLNIGFGVFKSGLHKHLKKAGFDDVGTSFGYVFRLLEDNPLNLKNISENLGITPQGALKLVNSMVEKKYIERLDDAHDGRIKHLRLTTRALLAMAEARKYHAQFEHNLAKRIGKQQAAVTRAALENIAANYGVEGPPNLRPL